MPTLPLVAAGVSLAATAVGAITSIAGQREATAGAVAQAQATSAAANYQAQVATNNQTIANQEAAAATQRGQSAALAEAMKNRATEGAIVTGQAASGIDVGTGSASDVQTSAAELGRLDTLTIEHNAALEAYGYKTQATSYGATAGLQKLTAASGQTAAQVASAAGSTAVAGTLIGTAGSLGSKYIQFQNAGIVGSSGTGATTPVTSSSGVWPIGGDLP